MARIASRCYPALAGLRGRAAGPLLLALLALAGPPARATVMRPLSVADLAGRSDVVLRGRVARVQVQWSAGGRIPVTVVDLEVLEVLEGHLPPHRLVTVTQPGGELDGVGLDYAGRPRFELGEESVVFLRRRASGRFIPVGLAQGKFLVEPAGPSGERALRRDLRGVALIATPDGPSPPIPTSLGELRGQLAARARELAGGTP